MIDKTPITPDGLIKYDHLSPMEATIRAWTIPGRELYWHIGMKEKVSQQMPLLARALNRLATEGMQATTPAELAASAIESYQEYLDIEHYSPDKAKALAIYDVIENTSDWMKQ